MYLIYDPSHYWNNFNSFFRGDILYEKILEKIPSDEKRKRKIATKLLIEEKSRSVDKEDRMSKTWNIMEELSSDGNTEIQDYVDSHDIQLIKIYRDFLEKQTLKKAK